MHCGDFSLAYRFGRKGMNRGLVRDRISGTARRSGSGGASRRWGVRCAEALFGSRGRRRLNFLRVKGVWPMELAGIAVDRLAVLKLAERLTHAGHAERRAASHRQHRRRTSRTQHWRHSALETARRSSMCADGCASRRPHQPGIAARVADARSTRRCWREGALGGQSSDTADGRIGSPPCVPALTTGTKLETVAWATAGRGAVASP